MIETPGHQRTMITTDDDVDNDDGDDDDDDREDIDDRNTWSPEDNDNN